MYFKLTAQQQHQSGTPDANFGNIILASLEIKFRCWRQAGSMLEACWKHAGNVLGPCWEMLEASWEHAGNVLGDAGGKLGACWKRAGRCWRQVESMLGVCWEMLEACREMLGACWKVFPQKLLEMLNCDLLLKMVGPREPIVCA